MQLVTNPASYFYSFFHTYLNSERIAILLLISAVLLSILTKYIRIKWLPILPFLAVGILTTLGTEVDPPHLFFSTLFALGIVLGIHYAQRYWQNQ